MSDRGERAACAHTHRSPGCHLRSKVRSEATPANLGGLKAALSSKGATGDHPTVPRHSRSNRGPLIAVPVRAAVETVEAGPDRRRLRGTDAKVSVEVVPKPGLRVTAVRLPDLTRTGVSTCRAQRQTGREAAQRRRGMPLPSSDLSDLADNKPSCATSRCSHAAAPALGDQGEPRPHSRWGQPCRQIFLKRSSPLDIEISDAVARQKNSRMCGIPLSSLIKAWQTATLTTTVFVLAIAVSRVWDTGLYFRLLRQVLALAE
jgi:hypothetical protein